MKKNILHNDIKCDNVVIAEQVKIIDFGKATIVSSPLIYNIRKGTDASDVYNKRHRHLAYELRNIPFSSQCFKTDIYSIGYMFKHCASIIQYTPIIQLGRLMKSQEIDDRISLANAIDKLNKI